MKRLSIYLQWLTALPSIRIKGLLLVALLLSAVISTTPLAYQDYNDSVQAETQSVVTTEAQPATTTEPSRPVDQTTQTTPTTASTAVTTTVAAAPAPQPAPVYDTVSIPSIGFSSRYVTVGLTSGNAIDVHPTLVGWWNGSAQPGSNGAVFLDGHNPGVFSKLPNIAVGATITINQASGASYSYTVVHREIVMLTDVNMRTVLQPYGGSAQGLNLMTCMGAYNPATGTTDQRLIVYAIRS